MIEILWVVFWVIGLLFLYQGGPWPPWSVHAYYMVMFALTGLALFDGVFRRSLGG